jgi:hypothetical protein
MERCKPKSKWSEREREREILKALGGFSQGF